MSGVISAVVATFYKKPQSCYTYSVTTITASGYVLLEVNWTNCDGTSNNYTYAQPGSTNFTYSFCAQSGSAYIVDGAGTNLVQGSACS